MIPHTMAKKVSSSLAPLPHNKKRKRHYPIKPTFTKRLTLKKILDYMKSDTYMFAPFANPESCPITSSQGGEESGGSIKTTKKLGYLRCNCYMYAPFVANSDTRRRIAVEKIRVQQEMVKRVVVGHNSCRSSPPPPPPPGKKAVSWKEPREIILY